MSPLIVAPFSVGIILFSVWVIVISCREWLGRLPSAPALSPSAEPVCAVSSLRASITYRMKES